MSDLLHSLVLSFIPGVGASHYWLLLEKFGSASNTLEQDASTLKQHVAKIGHAAIEDYCSAPLNNIYTERAHETLNWCASNNVTLIDTASEYYPHLLKEIPRCPPLLYILGDVSALSLPQIAVVGSRNPSPSGKTNAQIFCSELAAKGFAITSGLAMGIDAAAHRGALSGKGKTIAVMGTGIDQIYPKRNEKLAEQILQEGGALVSEFPLGTSPTPQNFPQRNRIVSGLSYGTLVVEAAIRSGSLITSRFAIEQNREVFAIPGAIQNPLSKGCHALIKQGAHLVETTLDIVAHFQSFLALESDTLQQTELFKEEPSLSAEESKVYAAVDYTPAKIDEIAERSHLAIGELLSNLMSLELKNLVHQNGDGFARS